MRTTALALTLGLLPLAACNGDDGGERIAAAAGAATLPTVVGGAASDGGAGSAATQPYTVVSGDSLWAISQQFCTTVGAIVAANGWADGEAHALFPGDVVAVPTGGCAQGGGGQASGGGQAVGGTPTTPAPQPTGAPQPTTAPSTTTVASANEVAAWIRSRDGFVPDPMYGDPSDYYEDFGPVCMEAWGVTYEFEKLGLGRDDVYDALEPLPGRTPSEVLAAIDRWAAFTEEWYLRYRDLVDEYADSSGDTDYDALIEDRDYLDFLAHYLPLADDQVAGHQYATTLCADLLRTKGSTP